MGEEFILLNLFKTKVTSPRRKSTAKVFPSNKIQFLLMASMLMVRNKAEVSSFGMMAQLILEISGIIKSMVMVSTNMLMEILTVVTGRTIKKMDKVPMNLKMVIDT